MNGDVKIPIISFLNLNACLSMSVDTQQIISSRHVYYVMNMRNDKWIKISQLFFSLEEAKRAYSQLLKEYPFARLGGSNQHEI